MCLAFGEVLSVVLKCVSAGSFAAALELTNPALHAPGAS
jgi:hypothetical protein